MELNNGDIIRFKNGMKYRDWILIHESNCKERSRRRRHTKDQTGFYYFGGPWYPGDWMTDEPYGKGGFELTVGSFNNIEVVGNLNNIRDYYSYKLFEKASDYIPYLLEHRDEEPEDYKKYLEHIELFEGKKRKQKWSI